MPDQQVVGPLGVPPGAQAARQQHAAGAASPRPTSAASSQTGQKSKISQAARHDSAHDGQTGE